MLIHNLKLSLRSLKKNRLYSFLNTTGFAIGFAVVMIIALFIYSEMTVDRCFEGNNRIFRIISSDENDCNLNYELAQQINDSYPEVETGCPVQYLSGWEFIIGCEGSFSKLTDLIATDNNFFSIFNLQLIEGFSSQPFSEVNSAVITQNLASKLFGNVSPLGKTIDIGGFINTHITGVIENFPDKASFYSDLFINIEDEKLRIIQSDINGISFYPANIYIRLNDANNNKLLEEKINRSNNLSATANSKLRLQPLNRIYFEKDIKNNFNRTANTSMLYLFTAIAGLILLLSIFNHVNFSISFQFARLRETGIKKTNGAGFQQLATYHFTENTVGILASFILSTGIVLLVLPLADRLFEHDLEVLAILEYPVNILILTLILTVIIITTIVPLYLVAKFDIRKFLSGEITGTRGGRINNILSVFQATVSIVLIIGVITIYKQLSYAKHAELGFDKEHLLRINLPGNFQNGDLVKQELGKFSFIKSSTLSLGVPGMINSRSGSGENDNQFWLNCLEVDEDFIETFGLELLDGRNFRQGDLEKACIINQAAFKKFGWENIEGKEFKNYGGLTVIGVANDFNVSSLHNAIEPAALIFKNRFMNTLTLRLEPGNIGQQMTQLKNAWEPIMPDYMFDYVFYDEFFNSLYQKEERLGQTVTIFSILAFIITLMGITGLIFQVCLSRTKEIGVRKVNGAKISEVMVMLNKDFVKWVVIAFVIATPVAWYAMNKWLQNFVYKTSLSWWVFALAGVLTLGIALLTVSWQSWRAATRNPVEALRYE
jgi:putative ABC transport system permease protein